MVHSKVAAFDVIGQFAFRRLIYQLKLNSVQDTWTSLNSIIKMFHITLSPMLIGWYILNCIELKRPASWLWKGQKVWKLGVPLESCSGGKTNCTKFTLEEEDCSLNESRTLRSFCVEKFITPPPSNTQSLISVNVTQCKYVEVWRDCVSTLYGTASPIPA